MEDIDVLRERDKRERKRAKKKQAKRISGID